MFLIRKKLVLKKLIEKIEFNKLPLTDTLTEETLVIVKEKSDCEARGQLIMKTDFQNLELKAFPYAQQNQPYLKRKVH